VAEMNATMDELEAILARSGDRTGRTAK
jgi:hypothetical protein